MKYKQNLEKQKNKYTSNMAKDNSKSTAFVGRIKGLGVTFYQRGGKVVSRIGTRKTPSYMTQKQFVNREKMRRSMALWNCMSDGGKPLMEAPEGQTAYNVFLKANAQLPTAFMTKEQARQKSALLMPGIVVSSGRLPQLEYEFAVLEDGHRVVLTNLLTGLDASQVLPLDLDSNDDMYRLLIGTHNPQLQPGDHLRFYRFEQKMWEQFPQVEMKCLEYQLDDDPRAKLRPAFWQFLSVEGRLAIADADYEAMGWAVVLADKDMQHASTQQVITTSTLYESYTTPEALKFAADTYGNVKPGDYLEPNPKGRE